MGEQLKIVFINSFITNVSVFSSFFPFKRSSRLLFTSVSLQNAKCKLCKFCLQCNASITAHKTGFRGRRGERDVRGTRQIYNCNRFECANRNGNIKIEKNVASDASGKGREEFVFFFC